jgi:hypothetical protein
MSVRVSHKGIDGQGMCLFIGREIRAEIHKREELHNAPLPRPRIHCSAYEALYYRGDKDQR